MYKYLLTCFLALTAACAHAGVGLAQVTPAKGDGPVTVFYPSSAADQPIQRGPFSLNLAFNGAPQRGNGRLVVLSHGSGGNPWVHSNLARTLVEAGFVVAMPQHQGDNAQDHSKPGPASWKLRPGEVTRAIDAVAQDARFAALLSLDKVGMYGMSAGGHTALSMAGGRWSDAQFTRHCEAHIAEDFASCVGLMTSLRGNFLDGLKKTVALGAIRMRFTDEAWHVHNDPRIRAVVAGVPYAADFDAGSLAAPAVPLGLVTARLDKWLMPRFHSDRILAACKTCELVADMPTAGHGALLSPLPPMDRLGEIGADLMGDPPGFDRAVLPAVDGKITAFFQKHLLP
ncbi:MAG TPA: dienelactone hydrolase [Ramlibacter sp.]|nr:dienelactone hydrolase [Ramlibacter sp.]